MLWETKGSRIFTNFQGSARGNRLCIALLGSRLVIICNTQQQQMTEFESSWVSRVSCFERKVQSIKMETYFVVPIFLIIVKFWRVSEALNHKRYAPKRLNSLQI